MGIKILNNATAVLAAGITTSDVTVTVATGTGDVFPTLTPGDYFYAVLEDTANNYEVVKVTARTSDAMTIVRAQEGTTAKAFPAGSLFDLRLTVQTFYDYVASLVGTAIVDSFTATGTTAPYTLSVAPTAIQQVIVVVGGVVQAPTVDYTVVGTSLTPVVAWPAGERILAYQFNPTSVLGNSLLPANNLSDLTNVATARSNLGLVIGSTVQAYDADTAKTDVAQNFTAPQRGTAAVDNDLSFDLNAANNFTCTPTAGGALTFTNLTAGQSGFIKLVNGSNYAITIHTNTKAPSTLATAISATGTYIISYYCDGTNVYVASAGAMV